jgi:hypothetical protein
VTDAFTFDVRSNIDEVLRGHLKRRDQQPFAIAKALTVTAQQARDEQQKEMPQRFTVRRPWVLKGVRIEPATKTNLRSVVKDIDPFMAIQETGGTKTSINHRVFDWGEYLAIPLDARKSKRDIVDKRDWPKNLIDPFILTARDGRKYLAVHDIAVGKGTRSVRTARGKQKRITGTRLMYVLVKRETLLPRLQLRQTVARVVDQRFTPNLRAAILEAERTAK